MAEVRFELELVNSKSIPLSLYHSVSFIQMSLGIATESIQRNGRLKSRLLTLTCLPILLYPIACMPALFSSPKPWQTMPLEHILLISPSTLAA